MKYRNLQVTTGGGWGYDKGSARFKTAVESAIRQAMQKHMRHVNISRQLKNRDVSYVVAEVVAHDGRVYIARPGVLGALKWRGELPDDPTTYRDVTSRWEALEKAEPSYMYHI